MQLTLGIPQLLFIVITILGTGLHLANHGKPKEGKWNFWHAIISDCIILSLLYWGEFFG